MTDRITLTPRAQADLDQIWDHTLERWGSAQAERYVRQLWHHVVAVGHQPNVGRACPEIREGYRKYRSGSHILFYRAVSTGTEIVRILHERMDVETHL